MTAEGLGKQLLDEVKEVRLDELLRSLRNLHNPQKVDYLGLPAIDQILNVFQSPSREQSQWEPPGPSTSGFPSWKMADTPPVIEITGATPCSGKTQLLYHIAMLSLVTEIDGSTGGAVVWLDTDNRFSILRLQAMLFEHLTHSLSGAPAAQTTIDRIHQISLQNIHVFQPQSTPSLLSTLANLPTYLLTPTLHKSGPLRLQTLIISNLSAFVHQDHLDSDMDTLSTGSKQNTFFFQRWRSLINHLRIIQRAFECNIVAGNWAFSPMQISNRGQVSLRPHLPSIWTQFCTLRLVAHRNGVSKFGPGMSVEEALRDRKLREEAVERGGFTCSVNFWGSDEWTADVVGKLKKLEGGWAFGFRVEASGVRISEVEKESQ